MRTKPTFLIILLLFINLNYSNAQISISTDSLETFIIHKIDSIHTHIIDNYKTMGGTKFDNTDLKNVRRIDDIDSSIAFFRNSENQNYLENQNKYYFNFEYQETRNFETLTSEQKITAVAPCIQLFVEGIDLGGPPLFWLSTDHLQELLPKEDAELIFALEFELNKYNFLDIYEADPNAVITLDSRDFNASTIASLNSGERNLHHKLTKYELDHLNAHFKRLVQIHLDEILTDSNWTFYKDSAFAESFTNVPAQITERFCTNIKGVDEDHYAYDLIDTCFDTPFGGYSPASFSIIKTKDQLISLKVSYKISSFTHHAKNTTYFIKWDDFIQKFTSSQQIILNHFIDSL